MQGVDDGQIVHLANLRPLYQSSVARRLAVILDVTGEDAPAAAGRRPLFDRLTDLQQWLVEGYVEFLEVFCGHAQNTCRIAEMGTQAGEGLDKKLCAYGKYWDLSDPATIELYSWLIAIGLRPRSVHLGTPCTWLSVLGKAEHPEVSQTF